MFCYQCEQTSRGKGCVEFGVCGKDADVAVLQDLLVYQLQGIAFLAALSLQQGKAVANPTHRFVVDGLFSTLTNVNFDRAFFIEALKQSQIIKNQLITLSAQSSASRPAEVNFVLPADETGIVTAASKVNIRPQAESAPDLQSLKDTLLYGMKGMAAYAHHAWVLGYQEDEVSLWFYKGLSAMLDDTLGLNELVSLLMEFGQVNLKCMELLDRANTTVFGHPEPTQALISKKKGPFIVISGHDLHDLKQLLEQTAGSGVNVYTHGEMLPALAYPELKKYPHLIGNYGSAWQNQQREFNNLPGVILMTTNCLMEPRPGYSDRIFTTGVVGWADIPFIPEKDGKKDFSILIQKALQLGGWEEDEKEQRILVGFGRQSTLSHAGEIVDAVKTGQIRHFFLVGGCDGAKPGRNYYTDFATQAPKDTVILTLACGKYRFNKYDFGSVAGLPRLLDIGQCNDAYSAIQIALTLANAFNCGVNELPLTLVLSWYEQKAVCILLTLLSLGIKNIYLGPTLPAFITPNVLNFLVEQFNIKPISNALADLAAVLEPVH
ncbi:MAG: hydroxylamine reductase [Anaerolineae bacterium]|nr:hydroxylamine reductase [Anaerolineae bacterium]